MYFNKEKDNPISLSFEPGSIMREHAKFDNDLYEKEQLKKLSEEALAVRNINEAREKYANYMTERYDEDMVRNKYLNDVKTAFLTECLMKIYSECSVTPLTTQDKVVAKNLITRFVVEHGAGNLINDFATKNLLLSEVSRICTKHYDQILEKASCDISCKENKDEKDDKMPLKLDETIGKDFLDSVENLECGNAAGLVKKKVAESISDFVNENIDAKVEYEDIINTAKEKIESAKTEDEVNDVSNTAKEEIAKMEAYRDRSVFYCIVESLTKSIFKDDKLKTKYIKEGKVDMDPVVNSAQLVYTMLEMVNTLNIVKVDEQFVTDYLKSIDAI